MQSIHLPFHWNALSSCIFSLMHPHELNVCHIYRDRTGFFISCRFNFPQCSQPKKQDLNVSELLQNVLLWLLFFLYESRSLLCHQLTLTFPAGNLISTLSYAFSRASVNLKHDEYCGKWIYKRWKWETQKITKTVPSVPLCCVAQRDNCKWNSV